MSSSSEEVYLPFLRRGVLGTLSPGTMGAESTVIFWDFSGIAGTTGGGSTLLAEGLASGVTSAGGSTGDEGRTGVLETGFWGWVSGVRFWGKILAGKETLFH